MRSLRRKAKTIRGYEYSKITDGSYENKRDVCGRIGQRFTQS